MPALAPPRIGVVVCECGTKISGLLDTLALCRQATTIPGVEFVTDEAYPCSQDGLARLRQAIQDHELTRVLIAGCPARLIRPAFHRGLSPAGIDPENVAVVDIREGCAFAHPDEPEAAQRKASDQIRMGIARLAAINPSSAYVGDIIRTAIVIGSDLGGLITATTLADQGIPVTLIGAHGSPGYGLDPGDGDVDLYETQLDLAHNHPQIALLLEAQITAVSGQPGDYTVQVFRHNETLHFHAGAIVVAIGIPDDAYAGPFSAPSAESDLQPPLKSKPAFMHFDTELLDPESVLRSPAKPWTRKLDSLASWLRVPQDTSGFLIKSRPRLRPGQYVDDGIFVVGNAHWPVSGPAMVSQALLVSARVLNFLQQTALRTESPRAVIESARCTGCGTCVPVCPIQAISLENRHGILSVAQIAALRCTGCGGCVAACPTRALNIPGWEDPAILAQISAALEPPPRLIYRNGNSFAAPRLLVFSCEWSAYAAAELTGARGVSYSPDLRFIPLNCAARFDPNHVLWAFLNGADGVLLSACRPGDCHHRTGNQLAAQRLAHLKSQLADHGVDPRRLHLAQFSGDDVEAFVRAVTEFSALFLNPDTLSNRLG